MFKVAHDRTDVFHHLTTKTTFLPWHEPCHVLGRSACCNRHKRTYLLCGNKMPTRCNRGFYCRSYCLLNMFRASLYPSSGDQEYYTVVAACGISCCGFSSSWSGVELRVMCPVCRMLQYPANRTHNPQLHTRPATWKPQHEIPQAATTVKYSWAPDDGHSGARNMLSKQ